MRSWKRSLLTRSLLVALAAAPLIAGVVDTPAAFAQNAPVFEGPGLVELVPPSRLVGDGQAVTLAILALNPDGSPMESLKGRIGATEGGTTDLEYAGGGVYKFQWTTPQVMKRTDVTFTLKAKSDAKESISRDYKITVQPDTPVQLQVSSSPDELILDQDASASLSIKLVGPGGQSVGDGAQLLVNANYGSVEAVTYLGNGAFTARYVPKSVKYPHLDVVTFADARDPSKVYGTHVIKMTGKTDFPVKDAEPNSTILLRIGDREFGPYQTDTTGRAVVPITVPPGIPTGTRITVKDGKQFEEEFDLQLPPTRRVAIFPMNTVPGDGGQKVTVRVAVRTATGAADPDARVNLSASAGTVTQPVHEGNGIYVATFTPPRMNAAGTATLTAALAGESGKTEYEVQVAPVRPGKVTLTAEPSQLGAGTTSFKVFAKVQGADGLGIDGQEISYVAAGARQGATKDLRNGDYQTTFSATSGESVQLSAVVLGPVSDNPLARVVLLPADERLANDGRSTTLMTVLTVDRYGYPVPNQTVNLSVSSGAGNIPGSVITDGRGVASVYYTAGARAGIATVEGRVGELHGSSDILLLPAGMLPDLELPATGSDATIAEDARFEGVVVDLVVPREGASGVAVADLGENTGAAGAMTSLAVSTNPPEVAPGGTVTVRVEAKDAKGRGVSGQSIQMLATGGTVGTVTERGGGVYEASLTANGTAQGQVMLVVTSGDGQVSQALPIPVSGNTWGENEEPTTTPVDPNTVVETAPNPPEEPKPPEPREPREQGEFVNGRIRASFVAGRYSYSQTRLASNSVLWGEDVRLGYDGGSPATPLGFDVKGSYWLDPIPYLGFEGQARMTFYSVQWPGTTSEIPDQVPHLSAMVMGRLPVEAGSAQFHVGVKAGYVYSDFITYQQGATSNELNYDSIAVSAFGTGAEIQAQFGTRAYVKAEYLMALRSAPFSHSAMFEAGVRPLGDLPLSVVGNFAMTTRTIDIVARDPNTSEEATIGTLEDYGLLFGGGLAYEF